MVVFPLLADHLEHRVRTDDMRSNLGQCPEKADICVVVFIDPQPREAGGALDNGEIVRRAFAVDIPDQLIR